VTVFVSIATRFLLLFHRIAARGTNFSQWAFQSQTRFLLLSTKRDYALISLGSPVSIAKRASYSFSRLDLNSSPGQSRFNRNALLTPFPHSCLSACRRGRQSSIANALLTPFPHVLSRTLPSSMHVQSQTRFLPFSTSTRRIGRMLSFNRKRALTLSTAIRQ